MLLVTGCLAVFVVAATKAAPAQAATASVLPTRSVAVSARHTGYSTLSALAIVNVYRGAVVTLSTATSGGRPLESEGSVTASNSGHVDVSRRVRGLRFRAGGSVVMAIVYTPPNSPGELYSKNVRIAFSARGVSSIRNECSLTFAGGTSTECKLPCPAPAGISVNYCKGLGFVLNFHAEFPYTSTSRAVRLTDLSIAVLHLGSSIAVFCAPGRGSRCPPIDVYPNLQTHKVRVLGLLLRPLTPGTSINIVLYKGNYTGHSIRLDVVAGNRAVIRARRLCTYPDKSRPQRCTRPVGARSS